MARARKLVFSLQEFERRLPVNTSLGLSSQIARSGSTPHCTSRWYFMSTTGVSEGRQHVRSEEESFAVVDSLARNKAGLTQTQPLCGILETGSWNKGFCAPEALLIQVGFANLNQALGHLSRRVLHRAIFSVMATNVPKTSAMSTEGKTSQAIPKDLRLSGRKKVQGDKKSRRSKKKKPGGVSPKAYVLVKKVLALSNVKEEIYGELDKWVAFQNSFPVVAIKQALQLLTETKKWERIVQVTKWMLSKGQGKTTGTYEHLLQALNKLGRPEEAKRIWESTFSANMGSLPRGLICTMITIYDRHNMPRELIKLSIDLQGLGRKLDKEIMRKVSLAYQKLGFLERAKQILLEYNMFNTGKIRSTTRKEAQGTIFQRREEDMQEVSGVISEQK